MEKSEIIKPLVSIAIATKNRESFCIDAIKSILSIESRLIELAVSDNSDSDLVKKYVDKLMDQRLVYSHTKEAISSIENFNRVLDLVSGEYVCMIGDDDGINPSILSLAKWAKKNQISVITAEIIATYLWKSSKATKTFFTKNEGEELTILPFDGDIQIINTQKALLKMMQNGCTNYADYKLPRLYHGLIQKKILDDLKVENTELFKGLSPDIYSSISIASRIRKHVYLKYPITIPGACPQSSSIQEQSANLKSNAYDFKSISHFKNRNDYKWSEYVPKIYCSQTIWADSGMAALHDFQNTELISKFNRHSLYAQILYANKGIKKVLIKSILNEVEKSNRNFYYEIFMTYFHLLRIAIPKYLRRAVLRFKTILSLNGIKIISNVENISSAVIELEKELNKRVKLTNILESYRHKDIN